MKKIILGLILISILSGCNTNIVENEATSDFRNVNWGMSQKDVKKFEKDVNFIEEDTKSILGETKINLMDANIIYTFENKKLNMCMIDIVDEHTNRNLYIDDYEKMVTTQVPTIENWYYLKNQFCSIL